MRFRTLVSILILIMTATTATANDSLTPFSHNDIPPEPEYSQTSSWLALPENADEFPVDIFWVYPTILMDDEHWLMDIDSPELQKAARNTLVKQASVFSNQANLYAPLYRQKNMRVLSLSEDQQTTLSKYGLDDVWQAFNYYLKHYNQGRPFILAGHSQGSQVLMDLMTRHWGTTGKEDQLVAAYIIGWSITMADMEVDPSIVMCEDASQTHCFISYNTVAAGRQEAAPTIIEGAVVTNPLTWTTEEGLAPASLNIGAKFFLADGSTTDIPHFTSAQVVDSGLVVDPIDPELVTNDIATFPEGVYHQFDYSLFYENLRDNVAERIDAFLNR